MNVIKNMLAYTVAVAAGFGFLGLSIVILTARLLYDLIRHLPSVLWVTVFAPVAFGHGIYQLIASRNMIEVPTASWSEIVFAPMFTLVHILFWSLYFGSLL